MVYLVGAGPGDPELITVKGLSKIKECDCIVYDRLATPELLAYVKPECERIFVGKEAGRHYKKQEEINRILVDAASRHEKVVRLKGGDSFVFGRGGEEIEALAAAGYSYELVPGITSAISVPELAGIPVTHRGLARSFHVITGHTKTSDGAPEYDYETIAKMEGTLVFLMGLSNLGAIADHLIQAGKEAAIPAAVISNGAMPQQRTVRGTLADIAEKVAQAALPSPAIIVIGETAALDYQDPGLFPKVGIVATDHLWEKYQAKLEELQLRPVRVCRMEVQELADGIRELGGALSQNYGRMSACDVACWIVFTSANAVRIFFREVRRLALDYRAFAQTKFAVIGSGTAEVLGAHGFQPDFVPSEYNVDCLARELAAIVDKNTQILLPRAKQANPILSETLRAAGAVCVDIPIYDVIGTKNAERTLIEALDYLVFSSGSGVRAFAKMLEQEGAGELPEQVKVVCIGEVTREESLRAFGRADLVAESSDVDGVCNIIR